MQDTYPHGMTARDSEDAAKLAAFQAGHVASDGSSEDSESVASA